MSYPDDLCQLVIKNMEIIEDAPKVVDHVEKWLFAAINERIEQRVSTQEKWKGDYERCTGDDGETSFAPPEWPKGEDGSFFAYYELWYMEAGVDDYWLSNAIGIHDSALRLQFALSRDITDMGTKEHKKRCLDFYNANLTLAETGFRITKDGIIYLPFVLDASKLAEEYPDIEEAFEPLDKALTILFKEHTIFDSFVKSFSHSQ